MMIADCRNCKYVVWLIGIGQGVRCRKEENQQYLPEKQRSPLIISHIPKCDYYKKRIKNET